MMTLSPFSVNSLAAQPPEMPDPITMASKTFDSAIGNGLSCMEKNLHVKYIERINSEIVTAENHPFSLDD